MLPVADCPSAGPGECPHKPTGNPKFDHVGLLVPVERGIGPIRGGFLPNGVGSPFVVCCKRFTTGYASGEVCFGSVAKRLDPSAAVRDVGDASLFEPSMRGFMNDCSRHVDWLSIGFGEHGFLEADKTRFPNPSPLRSNRSEDENAGQLPEPPELPRIGFTDECQSLLGYREKNITWLIWEENAHLDA